MKQSKYSLCYDKKVFIVSAWLSFSRSCPTMRGRIGCGCCYSTTLPLQPVRAAWWQPTLLIHVALIQRVRNVKHGADYECDSCTLPGVSVWWWICAGCGLGKLYSVVVYGVPPWLLKYDLYEILHRKGRKAKANESFAVRY